MLVVRDLTAPEFATYKWFSDQALERSEGRLQIEVKSQSQLLIRDKEVVTALRDGRVDFGEVIPTFPIIEGLALPGLFDNWDKAEKAHKAWQNVMKQYEKEMGGIFLGSTSYQKEYIYSSYPITIPASH